MINIVKQSIIISIFSLSIILTISPAIHAQTAQLETIEITAPTPPSMYNTDYQEQNSGQTTHTITIDNKTRTYHSYAPMQMSQEPRAAILLLHGANRTGLSMIDTWKYTADLHNIILIAPNTLGSSWDLHHDGTPFLIPVLNDAIKHHKIDRTRLYLFGHSAGATMSLYVTIAHSDLFAATSLHAGKFLMEDHKAATQNTKRKTPIAFFVGENDALFSIKDVKSAANSFYQAGHPTKLYIIKEHTHWYYDIASFINEKSWEFMRQHRIKQD